MLDPCVSLVLCGYCKEPLGIQDPQHRSWTTAPGTSPMHVACYNKMREEQKEQDDDE